MPALNEFAHLAEEEGQQQRAYVGTIDVRIGHDDDAVVTQLLRIELVLADTTAQRRDNSADFG